MTLFSSLIVALVTLALAPLAGGVAVGLDRKVTAHLQGRYGPSPIQPFYDVVKLLGKAPQGVNRWPAFFALLYLFGAAASVLLFVLGGDLLTLFFLSTLTVGFLVMGALAAVSPYSRLGADRELIQALLYEPMLLVVFMGFYHLTGTFDIGFVRAHPEPLLLEFPLGYLAMILVFLIKMHKGPVDFSAAHHAHQELVQGILTEYAGPVLAVVQIGHWFETVLLLLIFSLFWTAGPVGTAMLLAGTFLGAILLDSILPPLTWRWALHRIWIPGLLLVWVNLVWMSWI